MNTLNTVNTMAALSQAHEEYEKVATGLMEELEQTPGGIPALIHSCQRNGAGAYLEQWERGDTQPNPTAIETGLADTGLIERIAERTDLPPGAVRGSLSLIIPVLLHYVVSRGFFSRTGEPLGPRSDSAAILQAVLRRI